MALTRLLLGSAAGLALMSAGAQAADLPMKAKAPAVQYVKICSLYGAGYYYIPGTDTCLKVGGFVRVDAIFGPTAAPFESLNFDAVHDRTARNFNVRTRAFATFDARTQTEYGTLRSYFHIGGNADNPGGGATGVQMDRAFIQLAGFTWGLATSIFDEYSLTPFHLNYVAATNGSVGATGIWQWRYTAQFGNGFSASIAIEDPGRRRQNVFQAAGTTVNRTKGSDWPDVVGNLRMDAAWGSAQVAAAISEAGGTFYGGPAGPGPGTTIGYALMAGAFVKVPGLPGDTFGIQFTWAKGATGYATGNINVGGDGRFDTVKSGDDASGIVSSAIYGGPGTSLQLTTAWSLEAGYEHAWTPTLKTSIAGGFTQIDYNATATAMIAATAQCAGVVGVCNPDFSVWNIGSRTTWMPVPNLSLGVDVMYTHINSANLGANFVGTTSNDANVWTGLVRVQRVFWP